MIIGYLLVLGGLAQLATGWYAPVTVLVGIGGLWLVAGVINIAWSKRSRTGKSCPVDMTNPAARAKATQGVSGARGRGIVALLCAVAALAVGILRPGSDSAIEQWWPLPAVVGAFVGFLCLFGFFMYWASSVERSVTYLATVVVLGFKDLTVNHSSNNLPFVRFVLDVYPQGLTRYQTTIDSFVPILAVPHLAVGARFPAQVAGQEKPENVIVDWGSHIASASPAAPVLAHSPDTLTPPSGSDPSTRLRELDGLLSQGLVSEAEYESQRCRILDQI
ncbi:MAG: SHOCT domain-containing protein [Nakamurella sp.]